MTERRVLYAGRDSWEKNLPMLERACSRAGARLTMVSDRSWSEMPAVYQEADLFCLSSLYEGSPKALWEAMASGVPALISTAIEDQPPEGTALALDPRDEASWSAAIGAILTPGSGAQAEAQVRARRALEWVRRERDARVLIEREIAFVRRIVEDQR